ncbi:unnamed protein product [Jaminaea pallidilutea]
MAGSSRLSNQGSSSSNPGGSKRASKATVSSSRSSLDSVASSGIKKTFGRRSFKSRFSSQLAQSAAAAASGSDLGTEDGLDAGGPGGDDSSVDEGLWDTNDAVFLARAREGEGADRPLEQAPRSSASFLPSWHPDAKQAFSEDLRQRYSDASSAGPSNFMSSPAGRVSDVDTALTSPDDESKRSAQILHQQGIQLPLKLPSSMFLPLQWPADGDVAPSHSSAGAVSTSSRSYSIDSTDDQPVLPPLSMVRGRTTSLPFPQSPIEENEEKSWLDADYESEGGSVAPRDEQWRGSYDELGLGESRKTPRSGTQQESESGHTVLNQDRSEFGALVEPQGSRMDQTKRAQASHSSNLDTQRNGHPTLDDRRADETWQSKTRPVLQELQSHSVESRALASCIQQLTLDSDAEAGEILDNSNLDDVTLRAIEAGDRTKAGRDLWSPSMGSQSSSDRASNPTSQGLPGSPVDVFGDRSYPTRIASSPVARRPSEAERRPSVSSRRPLRPNQVPPAFVSQGLARRANGSFSSASSNMGPPATPMRRPTTSDASMEARRASLQQRSELAQLAKAGAVVDESGWSGKRRPSTTTTSAAGPSAIDPYRSPQLMSGRPRRSEDFVRHGIAQLLGGARGLGRRGSSSASHTSVIEHISHDEARQRSGSLSGPLVRGSIDIGRDSISSISNNGAAMKASQAAATPSSARGIRRPSLASVTGFHPQRPSRDGDHFFRPPQDLGPPLRPRFDTSSSPATPQAHLDSTSESFSGSRSGVDWNDPWKSKQSVGNGASHSVDLLSHPASASAASSRPTSSHVGTTTSLGRRGSPASTVGSTAGSGGSLGRRGSNLSDSRSLWTSVFSHNKGSASGAAGRVLPANISKPVNVVASTINESSREMGRPFAASPAFRGEHSLPCSPRGNAVQSLPSTSPSSHFRRRPSNSSQHSARESPHLLHRAVSPVSAMRGPSGMAESPASPRRPKTRPESLRSSTDASVAPLGIDIQQKRQHNRELSYTGASHPLSTPPMLSHWSQQQQYKRPTFGLDMQPDAAAAFDSIPSPHLSGSFGISGGTPSGAARKSGGIHSADLMKDPIAVVGSDDPREVIVLDGESEGEDDIGPYDEARPSEDTTLYGLWPSQ